MINIPLYRAKKIDSDEYVEGLLSHRIESEKVIGISYDGVAFCDPSTLSIHFPDMLDSQGNKIFASLSKDGKGGDCTFMENGYNETFMWDSLNGCIVLKSPNYECRCFKSGNRNETTFNKYTIIGIQE